MADQNLIAFAFDERIVRTVVDSNNEAWFVGKDVAEVLGYADTVNALKQHCKGVVKRHPLQTAGGVQETRIISEPDLFRLIVNSKLPSAERFERWVFEEVLPSIRKTGFYGRGPSVNQQLSAHGVRLRLLTTLKKERDPAMRRAIHAQLDHASRLLGIETPLLAEIGRDEIPPAESPWLSAFWEAVDLLVGTDDAQQLNHSRAAGLLALNLLQVERAAKAAKLSLPPLNELRRVLRNSQNPRFIDMKSINSRHGGTVKCWVFENEQGEEA